MKTALQKLARSSSGTLALTMSQLFMGALTIGIATFRGTESYESFYYETQLGHANYGASKLAADHARAANSNANNNVISTSIMGPRFAVEGDNITVLVDGALACAKCAASDGSDGFDCNLCQQFMQNYPSKMLPKLAWVRIKQALLWGSLGKLTSTIDKVASLAAQDQISSVVSGIDSQVKMRAVDPSTSGSTWGQSNESTACSNAQIDALKSPMPGSAFPPVMTTNLMGQGFSFAMTQIMPKIICAVEGAASGGGSGGGGGGSSSPSVTLPQIPSVANATTQDCNALQEEMEQQIAQQQVADGYNSGGYGGRFGGGGPTLGQDTAAPGTVFSSDVAPYVTCTVATASAPLRSGLGRAYTYVNGGGQLSTCTFNQAACQQQMLKTNSAAYLQSVGLPSTPSQASSSIGGSTLAPSDSNWNHSPSMQACSFASKPVDETIATINDNVTRLISFGNQSTQPKQLRASHEFQGCGKWYFPDSSGDFAGTPHDQQPFVAAWKYAMVLPGGGT
jgi:hypothetical protein